MGISMQGPATSDSAALPIQPSLMRKLKEQAIMSLISTESGLSISFFRLV